MNVHDIKVGTWLFADFGCTVSLTPTQRYEVKAVLENGIGIIDDWGREHLFLFDHIKNHFVIPAWN